jgi:hypothetical protein
MAQYYQQSIASESLSLPSLVLLHENYLNKDTRSDTLPLRVKDLDGWLGIERYSYKPGDISQELSRVQAHCGINRERRELSNAGIAVYLRLCASAHNRTHANRIKAAVRHREALRHSCGNVSEDLIGALSRKNKSIRTSLIAV